MAAIFFQRISNLVNLTSTHFSFRGKKRKRRDTVFNDSAPRPPIFFERKIAAADAEEELPRKRKVIPPSPPLPFPFRPPLRRRRRPPCLWLQLSLRS